MKLRSFPGQNIRPEVHAHRGCPLRFAENTVPSFMCAIESGADFVELDLQVSRDDKLVVSHDPHLPSGELIRSVTLDRARAQGCPTFEEVLDLPAYFNIEIKSYPPQPEFGGSPEGMARLVVEMVQGRGLESRVLVQSFDFRVLHAVCELSAAIERCALWEGSGRDFREIADEAGTRCVSIEHSLIAKERVLHAHDYGIRVLAWTVNGVSAWNKILDSGVDGIITDDALGLVRLLNRQLF